MRNFKIELLETGEIIEVKDRPYLGVYDGYLGRGLGDVEAVSGDVVHYYGKDYVIPKGKFSDAQLVPFINEKGEEDCIIVSAEGSRDGVIRKDITHNTKVRVI